MTPDETGSPLSFAQEQLWFVDQLRSGASIEYLLHETVRLRGPLDEAALTSALTEIAARHEVLRTRYAAEGDSAVQIVDDPAPVELRRVDLSARSDAEQQHELRELIATERRTPIDLRTAAPWRLTLARLGETDAALLVTVHHIAFDAASWVVLARELDALYGAFRSGEASPPAPPLQYADFAQWERDRWAADAERTQRRRGYWRERLAGLEPLELPADRHRPAHWDPAGADVTFTVPAAPAARLTELGRDCGATPFMVHLAAFQLLLARHAGRDDVAVGVSVSRRDQPELEHLLGMFLNTVVLRTDLSGSPTFRELLGRVREGVLDAYDHQDVPFDRVVADLAPERDQSRNPVFQAAFALHTTDPQPFRLAGLDVDLVPAAVTTSPFDLSLHLDEEADGSLTGRFFYPTALFDHARIDRMAGHLLRLLTGIAEHPDAPVHLLDLLTDAESRALQAWNRTDPGTPTDTDTGTPTDTDTDTAGGSDRPYTGPSLPELFLAQAEATPDAVAVVAGALELSYAELADRTLRLAHRLTALGVTGETPVGVALHRGADLVTALLAVLTAGGTYVPLAPDHPADRLAYLVADAGVELVITEESLRGHLPDGPRLLVPAGDAPQEADALATPVPVGAEDAAYVMYTSGSTGRPKGVVVPHAAIRNRVLWSVEHLGLGPGDRLLQKTTIGFDAAVWEFLSPLVCGATVVTAPADAHRDTAVMARAAAEHGVTVLQLVPSVLRLLLAEPGLADCSALRVVCSAGEPLPAELCDRLRTLLDVEVVNTYGPTECAIDSTAWHHDRAQREGIVPIGLPLTGARVHVVDAHDRLVPVGVPGELCVAGIGLARGYLGRPGLTAERFTPNPYPQAPGERWYRTGDLVRRRADGALEFIARLDDQVKVRGVRIEPGEIEAALAAHPAVRAAAVATHRSSAGDLELAAYVVPEPGGAADPEDLRAHLAARLPEAMVPSTVQQLDALPLTPSGKVDRKQLPSPQARERSAGHAWVAPRTTAERAVAEAMAEVLEVDRVGAEDDFFALGGHSLVAIRMVLRLRRTLGTDLTVGDLFATRTVAALAARVDAARATADDGPAVLPVPRTGDLPLSFGQQRLWFLDQLEPGSDEYLVPLAVRLRGPFDVDALRRAVDAVTARHEVLRTRYLADGGDPRQVVDPAGPVPLWLVDLAATPDAEEQAQQLLANVGGRPFDLAAEWPLRVTVIRTAPDEHLLALTLHHIVCDGWSTGLLLADLDRAYRALAAGEPSPLRPQPVHYADFAVWQRERENAGALAAQLDHWRERLTGLVPVELPTDRLRAAVRDTRGATFDTAVPAELGRELTELARRSGVTPFVLLLAAFQVLLGRHTGREDVAVGTPVAGRTRPETEDLVGFFTNTLVIRTDLAGDPRFTELLEQVHRASADALAHQDVPFEHLVDALRPDRDLSRNPLFQVMFELQRADGLPSALGDATAEWLDAGPAVAKFDLTVTVTQHDDGGLRVWFEYATALFDRATMDRLAGHYLTLLQAIAAAPDTRLGDLGLLTDRERHQLLDLWPDPDGHRTAALDPADEHDLCVPQLIERTARRTPDAVAVVAGQERIGYAELNARANRLAHRLRDLGVRPETVVASCLERSVEAVVTLVAVLKAGGVYVPLDPRHPAERLGFMLADAGAELVLTTSEFADRTAGGRYRTVLVDDKPEQDGGPAGPADQAARTDRADRTDPAPLAGPGNLAYVIYTSGSTGRPKGVMIEHRSYAHHCRVIADAYGITAGERVVLLSALTFDVAMDQIAATLVAGATIVVGAPEFWTPAELPSRLAEFGVTVVEITPAYYRAMLESPDLGRLTDLKLMNVGSDVVTVEDARRWADTGLPGRFLGNYGPTEATVTCLLHPVGATDRADGRAAAALPIGRPVPGTRAHVLDADLRPVPVGVPGELCLGGVRLARGYHRRPGLTAERFVPDPLATAPGQRLYRTGDLVRRRPDGAVEFLGRIDRQVKLRGLRIELGEIEAALARHPAVREAVVVAAPTAPGERQLVGYLVAGPGEEVPPVAELRAHLRDLLPEYMIPARWTPLAEFPMTSSGKVDRRALPDPAPAGAEDAADDLPPEGPVQETLAAIWSEILGLPRIGARDDFFALGGHSLLATRVLAALREAFAIDLPLRRLFEATTVAALAEAVQEAVEADIDRLTDDEIDDLLTRKGVR
ncbi:amino acid adenylation domain-containing protein [Kitasatospora sp. NPDC059599]|uniref:amino acid adenylation domain-containing protein n=1 Tax=Kitasatospora sp. NPDC059599 TaxID=3346880 RepID=UPI0036C5CBE9